MKPVVRYRGKAAHDAFSSGVYLCPIDHPNHLPGHDVSNGRWALTSAVVSFDVATGRIETKNTIYLPEDYDVRQIQQPEAVLPDA